MLQYYALICFFLQKLGLLSFNINEDHIKVNYENIVTSHVIRSKK